MTITLIYTARQANLTIDASRVTGPLEIARMGPNGEDTDKKQLVSGAKDPIPVGSIAAGVYKVSAEVIVKADIADPHAFVVMAVETKDPPPDQPKATIAMAKDRLGKLGVDAKKLHAFIVDARGGINIALPGPSAR